MPLGMGITVHDDSKHTGNAKREIANGVAGLDAASKIIKRLNYENVANGVAKLDASTLIPDILLPSDICRIASNSYVGNSSVNRAIPHGLGKTPKLVVLTRDDGHWVYIMLTPGVIAARYNVATSNNYTVTSWDNTNFYVGHASSYAGTANDSPQNYDWVAIA